MECEGGVYRAGRHTRGQGFENDCRKYNTLTCLGYRVLRFTTGMLDADPEGSINQVRQLLNETNQAQSSKQESSENDIGGPA